MLQTISRGSFGLDRIQGMAGADTMAGGRGDDELTGEPVTTCSMVAKVMIVTFRSRRWNDQISGSRRHGSDRIWRGTGVSVLMVDRLQTIWRCRSTPQDTLVLKDWFGGNPLFRALHLFDGTTLLAADIEQRPTAPGDVLVGPGVAMI